MKPAYLKKIVVEDKPPIPEDKLDRLTSKAEELAFNLQVKSTLEEQLTSTNKTIERIRFNELPDLMFDCKVENWTLMGSGNIPSYKLERKPFYYANIKQDAPEAPEAFDWLDKHHPGLVRTTFTISFGKGEEKLAARCQRMLKRNKIEYEKKRAVPWNTLTAFLKEQVEKYKVIPPLNLLGAKLATVVDMKPITSKAPKAGKAGALF